MSTPDEPESLATTVEATTAPSNEGVGRSGEGPTAPEEALLAPLPDQESSWDAHRIVADLYQRATEMQRYIRQLSTRNRALEGAIEEHNKRCERECYEEQKIFHCDNCAACPRRYMIEVPNG